MKSKVAVQLLALPLYIQEVPGSVRGTESGLWFIVFFTQSLETKATAVS